jgi:Mg2+ and Co2+ transporter CorA
VSQTCDFLVDLSDTTLVLVWSDAGEDATYTPVPDTPNFQESIRGVEHCPVFFEKDLHIKAGNEEPSIGANETKATRQPLSVLPSRYGETLDWATVCDDPLLVLQELFYFQTASAGQYLDMLRKLIEDLTMRLHPTGDSSPTMEDILHYEYTKTVLVRWSTHFSTLLSRLNDQLLQDNERTPEMIQLLRKSYSPIKQDIEYLRDEADVLIGLCESGKDTIMSSFTVYASRRAAEESSLVTKLTKATNRITLIFLPISLVTSVFGMNFRQFGQGPLSITLWVTIIVPLLALCILVSEWGGRTLRVLRSQLLGRQGK